MIGGALPTSIVLVFAIALGLAWPSPSAAVDGPEVHTKVIVSKPLAIRGIVKSMQGADDVAPLTLGSIDDPAELLWIVGFESQIVEADGETPANADYLCHTNLDLHHGEYKRLMYDYRRAPLRITVERLFTLSQGILSMDFPAGLGLPVSSHQGMSLFMQVLNHNQKDLETHVRHRVTIRYVRDRDLQRPMLPLRLVGAEGLKAIEAGSGVWNAADADEAVHGESCSMGEPVMGTFTDENEKVDVLGQKFTSHWVVQPGVEVNHTNATGRMALEADTMLHYAVAHLHPFAEYIELNDVTAGQTVFRFDVEAPADRIGIIHVPVFSSEEGVLLRRGHEYQLVSRYNNTTDTDQDAMAALMMYVHDKGFN